MIEIDYSYLILCTDLSTSNSYRVLGHYKFQNFHTWLDFDKIAMGVMANMVDSLNFA